MNSAFAPLFANGMIILEAVCAWCPTVAATTLIALVALILALARRTRETSKWVAPISLLFSFAPAAILLWYAGPLARYGDNIWGGFYSWIGFSLLPIVLSAVGVWRSRAPTPAE